MDEARQTVFIGVDAPEHSDYIARVWFNQHRGLWCYRITYKHQILEEDTSATLLGATGQINTIIYDKIKEIEEATSTSLPEGHAGFWPDEDMAPTKQRVNELLRAGPCVHCALDTRQHYDDPDDDPMDIGPIWSAYPDLAFPRCRLCGHEWATSMGKWLPNGMPWGDDDPLGFFGKLR